MDDGAAGSDRQADCGHGVNGAQIGVGTAGLWGPGLAVVADDGAVISDGKGVLRSLPCRAIRRCLQPLFSAPPGAAVPAPQDPALSVTKTWVSCPRRRSASRPGAGCCCGE